MGQKKEFPKLVREVKNEARKLQLAIGSETKPHDARIYNPSGRPALAAIT
jgi:hypothetical protein